MIVVKGVIPIDPSDREHIIDVMSKLAAASRAENGVIEYHVSFGIEDNNLVHLFEQYEDEIAYDDHMETEHLQNFLEELPSFQDGEVEVTRFEVESATELEV
jgi:quinol monooxygenase YgiN